MTTSEAVTRGVRVFVTARFVPDRSRLDERLWFFAYTIRITNEGDEPVQLISRHWFITDSTGKVEEVRGPGVVGHQPRLERGESFEYTSACPLRTPFGTMQGTYEMRTDEGATFDAVIAPFALGEPWSIN